jgi:DNA helicase-2/ATP-dependent DNA helicase PcrA
MSEVLYSELSDEQRAVVDSHDRYLVVLASAGSGKTEVVAQRVERLLAASESDFKVVALSYTRRAAAELRARFAERLGDGRRRIETDTLHGFAQRLLTQYGTWIGLPAEPVIVTDDADRVDLFQAWRAGAGLEPFEDPQAKLQEIDLCRARGLDHPLIDDWASALSDAGALDYEAMLTRATELLEVKAIGRVVARIYRHVIVDEAQNLTRSQYVLIEQFLRCSDDMNALLVGDDKQSIVGFAGASVEHLESFRNDFGATVFQLTCNFRSARAIARVGDNVAAGLSDTASSSQKYAAPGEVRKQVFRNEALEGSGVAAWIGNLLSEGLPETALSAGESRHLTERDIAVLARSAASLRGCERALNDLGIVVSLAAHADDWLMSDIGRDAWLLGTFRPDSAVSVRRVMRELRLPTAESVHSVRAALESGGSEHLANVVGSASPRSFIETISQMESDEEGWYQDQGELRAVWTNFCDAQPESNRTWSQFELFIAQWQRGDDEKPGVRLQTVHKSQGREFKAVAVVGLNEGQFPDFRARDKLTLESELRAFYVATTRPSRCLLLTRPMTTESRNGPWSRDESRFLKLVLED